MGSLLFHSCFVHNRYAVKLPAFYRYDKINNEYFNGTLFANNTRTEITHEVNYK